MNKPATVSFNDPRPQYHAISDGKAVFTGTRANMVAYVAKKRAEGFDLQCYVDPPRGRQFLERATEAEEQVEIYPVSFRIYETVEPTVYLPNVFRRLSDALKHRAEILNDVAGTKYSIQALNWQGSRL